jgi:hypothetical protein
MEVPVGVIAAHAWFIFIVLSRDLLDEPTCFTSQSVVDIRFHDDVAIFAELVIRDTHALARLADINQ